MGSRRIVREGHVMPEAMDGMTETKVMEGHRLRLGEEPTLMGLNLN